MDGVNYVCHVNLNAQGVFLGKRQDSRVPYDKNSIKFTCLKELSDIPSA